MRNAAKNPLWGFPFPSNPEGIFDLILIATLSKL
jgi:hypothetical protein